MENLAKQFKNYPAFAYNFEPVTILKTGKDNYTVFRGSPEPENQIQRGSKEYINGWLYGAVQAVCCMVTKRKCPGEEEK